MSKEFEPFEEDILREQEEREEPDTCPCYVCGCTMYQVSYTPEDNICSQACMKSQRADEHTKRYGTKGQRGSNFEII